MADEKVGKTTGKKTQAGRDVYETPEGEMVSEKSTTIEYRGKWINVPTIHGGTQYSENELIEMLDAGLIQPTSMHNELEEAIEAAQSRSNSLEFNKGGIPMQKQMELFEDGGLRDEGGMIDEESGNDVPSGSTRKEVRDDIPAMISEGEFIFPADVVRYIGLDKLMRIRQDAKMGLKEMEAMGQMGNSDEATVPDDLPFGMADLIIVEEPEEKAHGGMVHEYNTGGIVWPTHPTIPVKTVTYHNPETGEKIEVRTQQGVPIDSVPEGFVLFDATPVTPTTPVTQPIAPLTSQRNVSNDDDSTPPPVNKFVEAGGWNGSPLETYISEAEKVTGLTGSIMSGIAGAIGGPLVGIFVHLAQKANKNKILATIDARIEEAKKTTVPGQVAALRAMKDKLEGKTDNQSILGKIGDVLSGVVENIGESLGLTTEQKSKVKKIAIAAENAPPPPTQGDKATLDKTDQVVVNAVLENVQLSDEEKRNIARSTVDIEQAENAAATVENMIMGSSYDEIPSYLNKLAGPAEPAELDKNSFLSNVNTTTKRDIPDVSPITLSLDTAAKTDANVPPPLIQPDTLPPRTSIVQNNANELIARSLASEQLNLSDKIKELVGINTLGDAPIAGTSKDPRVTSPTTELNADTDSEDNYNINAAKQRRKKIYDLTGQGGSTTVPVPTTVPTQTTTPSGGGGDNSAHKDMMKERANTLQKAAKEKTSSLNLSSSQKTGGAELDRAFGISGLSQGGLSSKPKKKTNSKKRGLAARK